MIRLSLPPLTAADAALRIGRGRLPCWLASPAGDEISVGRELLACDPVRVVRVEDPGGPADERRRRAQAALVGLDEAWQEQRAGWGEAPPGTPVAAGYLSYDFGRWLEPLRTPDPPAAGWPALEFRFYDAFLVLVRETGQAEIWARDEAAGERLGARLRAGAGEAAGAPAGAVLGGSLPPDGRGGPDEASAESARAVTAAASGCVGGYALTPFAALDPPGRHLAAVERVRAYLRAGDAYQVNVARRLRATLRAPGPPGLALFARLLAAAPAPHAFWFADSEAEGGAGRALVGNSPERFLRLGVDGRLETAPIKGTRPRGPGEDPAGAEARALLAHPKDHAEHVMIVDLERNDLGRVCAVGSVEVAQPLRLLALPSVFHLVSTVRGRLRPGCGLPEILTACFPGGSITGAPKIRAMEIIDELEGAARGPYTGATGWLGAAGDFDLAIAIRTALLVGEELTLWVGGGVVIDSTAEAELQETLVKAQAFARLVNAPGRGLD